MLNFFLNMMQSHARNVDKFVEFQRWVHKQNDKTELQNFRNPHSLPLHAHSHIQ